MGDGGITGGSMKIAAKKAKKATVKAEQEFRNMKEAHNLFMNLAKQTKNGGKGRWKEKTKKGGRGGRKSKTSKKRH